MRRCLTTIRCSTSSRCSPGRRRYSDMPVACLAGAASLSQRDAASLAYAAIPVDAASIEHAYAVSLARAAPPWLTDAATLAGVVARTGADRAESPVDAALPIGIAPSSARFTNRRCMILHRSQALLHSSASLPPQPGAQCFPVTKQRCHFASRRCSLSGAAC